MSQLKIIIKVKIIFNPIGINGVGVKSSGALKPQHPESKPQS